MAEISEYTPGTFCWVELGTSDAAGAKAFYGELFGWAFNDVPVGSDAVYTMVQIEGKDVAALYQLNQEMLSQGVPAHWLSYVSVASADETAQKAGALGGTVLKEPFDVFDAGRMAVLQESTGAVFAVWQPGTHIGARVVNEPGTLCWNELATRDTETASRFYTQLFGWQTNTQQMGPMTYTSFMNGDRPAGGMLPITEEWGDAPPNWMVYFAVEDCDRSADRATSLGARIIVPPTDIPEVGRFAVIQDPQGAVFSIISLQNPA